MTRATWTAGLIGLLLAAGLATRALSSPSAPRSAAVKRGAVGADQPKRPADPCAFAFHAVRTELRLKNDKRATSIRWVSRQLRTYLERRLVSRRAHEIVQSVKAATSDGWRPFEGVELTLVQSFPPRRLHGRLQVRFVAYETVRPVGESATSRPLERYRVLLSRQGGALRMVSKHEEWLTDDGPFGVPGDEAPAAWHGNG
jgi:hypothetical protein